MKTFLATVSLFFLIVLAIPLVQAQDTVAEDPVPTLMETATGEDLDMGMGRMMMKEKMGSSYEGCSEKHMMKGFWNKKGGCGESCSGHGSWVLHKIIWSLCTLIFVGLLAFFVRIGWNLGGKCLGCCKK